MDNLFLATCLLLLQNLANNGALVNKQNSLQQSGWVLLKLSATKWLSDASKPLWVNSLRTNNKWSLNACRMLKKFESTVGALVNKQNSLPQSGWVSLKLSATKWLLNASIDSKPPWPNRWKSSATQLLMLVLCLSPNVGMTTCPTKLMESSRPQNLVMKRASEPYAISPLGIYCNQHRKKLTLFE